jgi:di/tripeptidase
MLGPGEGAHAAVEWVSVADTERVVNALSRSQHACADKPGPRPVFPDPMSA